MRSASDDVEIFYLDDMEDEIMITEMSLRRENLELEIEFYLADVDMLSSLEKRLETAQSLPGLIVTDINMPGKGGIHLVKTLRADETYKDVVIGVCTGSDNPADHAAAEDAGADFVAVKPFDSRALVQICEKTGRFELAQQDGGKARLCAADWPSEAA